MNTVRAMKLPRACIPLSPNTIRQTKGSRVRSPAGSQRTDGDYDGKVSGRPRSARLERANEPRRLALDHVRLRQELSRRVGLYQARRDMRPHSNPRAAPHIKHIDAENEKRPHPRTRGQEVGHESNR